jgi:anti-sigma factor RsiW
MHHPNETDLALYAGNDLGRLARVRVDWHLRSCGKCQQDVTEFSSMRAEAIRSAAEPEVNWDRLAAEMKANIRLGLEAGECIGPAASRSRMPSPWSWAALATAALIGIVAGGEIWINHPGSLNTASNPPAKTTAASLQEVVLEVKNSGIQMRDGDSVTSEVSNSNDRGAVVYSVNAQGGVGASYVDPDTGTATVNNIFYGQ